MVCCSQTIILLWILPVEVCDERTIPVVDHASYELSHFSHYKNYVSIPPSLRQNFTIPKHVAVRYTCDKGYYLRNASSSAIGCKYDTTPRKFSNGSIHNTVLAKAVWDSAEGVICDTGKKTIIIIITPSPSPSPSPPSPSPSPPSPSSPSPPSPSPSPPSSPSPNYFWPLI